LKLYYKVFFYCISVYVINEQNLGVRQLSVSFYTGRLPTAIKPHVKVLHAITIHLVKVFGKLLYICLFKLHFLKLFLGSRRLFKLSVNKIKLTAYD